MKFDNRYCPIFTEYWIKVHGYITHTQLFCFIFVYELWPAIGEQDINMDV